MIFLSICNQFNDAKVGEFLSAFGDLEVGKIKEAGGVFEVPRMGCGKEDFEMGGFGDREIVEDGSAEVVGDDEEDLVFLEKW